MSADFTFTFKIVPDCAGAIFTQQSPIPNMSTPLNSFIDQTVTLNVYDIVLEYDSFCGPLVHELSLTDGGTTYLTMVTDDTVDMIYTFDL